MQFSSRRRISLLLHILILSTLYSISVCAFSLDRLNKKDRNRNLDIERNNINAKRWQLVPVFISAATLTLGYPVQSASANIFNNNVPNEVVEVVAANLADTDAFKKLPLERTYSGAIKEIRDQQDLQDDRLHECATKGSRRGR